METRNNCETIITKLMINEKPVYIKVIWENNDTCLFSIHLYLEESSWLGKYENEVAKTFIQRFRETKEEYELDVKSCLSNMNPMFKYDFNVNNENKGTFSWKKKFDGSAVKLHGSVEMVLGTGSKTLLIDNLIQENQSLRNSLDVCRFEIKQRECNLIRYKYELEKLNNINSSLEHTLLARFEQLLNSKKRRIQILEDALNNID